MDKSIAELEAETASAKTAAEAAGGLDETLNQAFKDSEAALLKAKAPSHTTGKTEAEKAAYSLQRNAERAKELGLDPAKVLGINGKVPTFDGDLPGDTVLTVDTFRALGKQEARKTAEQMADAIADPIEREAVKAELKFIVPSGDAQADFRRAQASALADRNAKIAEEAQRTKSPGQRTAAGASQGRFEEQDFVPTPDEERMMKPPYNLSKEKIIAARAHPSNNQ